MHEVSLMQSVVALIEDQARREHFRRVVGVRLRIGRLSGVQVEAMRFCFDPVMQGTVAEGATLTIEEPPGQGDCAACGETVPVEALYDPCARCGGWPVRVTAGTEMNVVSLDVE